MFTRLDLIELEGELRRENIGETVSLNKFYAKLFGIRHDKRSSFGKGLEVADKNDEVSFPFGEILISTKGFWIITDAEGNKRVMSSDLRRLIHNVESLPNQLKRGRILLAVDKNGSYIPDLDDVEVENPVWNEERKIYDYSKKLKDKARVLIEQRDDVIRSQDQSLEQQEIVISGLRREMGGLKRAKLLYETDAKVAQTDTSKAMDMSLQYTKKNFEMMRQIINLSEGKKMFEDRINVFEKIIKEVLQMLEQTGSKTEFKKAQALYKTAMEDLRLLAPEPRTIESPIQPPQLPPQSKQQGGDVS